MNQRIPLVDLRRQHALIADQLEGELQSVFASMRLFLGPNVQAFEHEYAEYLGARHALGVSDGTMALHLALRACGIGPGDEVITVSHTFFATVEAILLAGATPVFVDVDAHTQTMSVEAVAGAITERTRAVVPVHLHGRMADMEAIMALARAHDLRVIEDACQAHGAHRDGRFAGTIGDIGCFSFYYSKNLGAYGEAGGVVTNDDHLAERARVLRDHGSATRYHHDVVGVNGRLDEVQAAVLRLKLPHLDAGNRSRRRHAEHYNRALRDAGVLTPALGGDDNVFHLYVIRVQERDALQGYLSDKGIGTGIHYPVPCHLQPACREWSRGRGSLPVTEQLVGEIISLPMFPELQDSEVEEVCDVIADFTSSYRGASTEVTAAE